MKNAVTSRAVFDRYLTAAEERQLFGHVKQHGSVFARRDAAWMLLLRKTGIRVGALHGLNVADATQALRTKHLALRSEIMKGQRAHTVFLHRDAEKALRALLKVRKEQGQDRLPDGPLLVSRLGKRLSVRSLQARMKHWMDGCGLSICATPHWFRHTLAKRVMEKSTSNNPRGIVQVMLGHSNVNSTAVYTLPDKEEVEQAWEELA